MTKMTNEEAIKRLHTIRDGAIVVLDSGFGTHEGESSLLYERRVEFCDVLLEAAEKQIPKTPALEGDGYSDGELVIDTWYCPNCDTAYELDYYKHKYCPECGQRIDWGGQRESEE